MILPGFGNDMVDYINPLGRGESRGMVTALKKRGWDSCSVVSIKRGSWLNIAKGIFQRDFWDFECTPETLYSFYLEEVDRTVRQAVDEADEFDKCVLLGHSAGGWLARASLAMKPKESMPALADLVGGVCTLGAPHKPPLPSTPDMTRGALTHVNSNYPGAFLQDKVFYISVAGTAIESNLRGNKIEKFAVDSYAQVSGMKGEGQIGDGVVPLSNAHLDGAAQLTLPGVYHSISAPNNFWYGGEDVIDFWLPILEKYWKNNSFRAVDVGVDMKALVTV